MRLPVLAAALAAVVLAASTAAATADGQPGPRTAETFRIAPGKVNGWATYASRRYGFAIDYPAWLFRPDARAGAFTGSGDASEGAAFASVGGRARLVTGAFARGDGVTLASYRALALEDSYKGARVTWAPLREDHYVLSGYIADQIFYERVALACGGRVMTVWALTYPAAERRLYDRVVEAMAASYRPAGRGQGCET